MPIYVGINVFRSVCSAAGMGPKGCCGHAVPQAIVTTSGEMNVQGYNMDIALEEESIKGNWKVLSGDDG